jgi:guanylate kinase
MANPHMPGILFIVSGPSGSGKSSLCHIALRDLNNIRFSVSYTTRTPRQNEIEGKDYFFISEEVFHRMQLVGEFLEWAHVYGNYYATGRPHVQEILSQGLDVLLDIDVQGAQQVKERVPAAVATLVFPPDYATLQERLRSRALDRDEVILHRLEIARGELLRYRGYDYLIINRDLATAGEELKAVITASRCRMERQAPVADSILKAFGLP